MNHREPPHSAAGVRRALRCLSLLLLPTLASTGTQAWPRRRVATDAQNSQEEQLYLPLTGAPALRFLVPPPLPDPNVRPPVAPPPKSADPLAPDFTAAQSIISAENARAADATGETPSGAKTEGHAPASMPAKSPPAPILRDDIRPTVKPDDFLPFFQIPGSASRPGDVIFTVPVPATVSTPAPLPPSSATYTQTPK